MRWNEGSSTWTIESSGGTDEADVVIAALGTSVGDDRIEDEWAPLVDRFVDDHYSSLRAELLASRRDPYRRLSRLFHLIARRPV